MADTDIPPPPRPVEYEGMTRTTGTLLLGVGVALVVLGLVLLANPFAAIWILGVLIGVSLVLAGLAEVVAGQHTDGPHWPFWVIGAAVVAGGVAVIVWPDATVWVLALLAGIVLTLVGVLTLLAAVTGGGDRGARLVMGLISLAAGAAMLAWPEATLVVVAVLIGLRTVLAGGIFIAMGWNVRRINST